MANEPLRRCRVCRKQAPKSSLIRWTVRAGVVEIDSARTAPGRGYYSCSEKCSQILPRTIKGIKKA